MTVHAQKCPSLAKRYNLGRDAFRYANLQITSMPHAVTMSQVLRKRWTFFSKSLLQSGARTGD